MRKPGGYALIVDPDADRGRKEIDSFTCFHCCRVVWVKPFQDPAACGALCKVCMKHICNRCADLRDAGGLCTPWERQMEEAEAKQRLWDAVTRLGV